MRDYDDNVKVIVASIYGAKTQQGLVEITIGDTKIQVTKDKAREIRGLLDGAIEAAVSDELFVAFLTTRMGIALERIGPALLDFRELRQGSKGTVFPS